jgi:hypothetical protein
LEGKDVKDLLLNVGSGGGAAAAGPSTGGAPAAGGAVAEEKVEEKVEGKLNPVPLEYCANHISLQIRKSRTRTWVSVFSIRCSPCSSIYVLKCMAWVFSSSGVKVSNMAGSVLLGSLE